MHAEHQNLSIEVVVYPKIIILTLTHISFQIYMTFVEHKRSIPYNELHNNTFFVLFLLFK